MQPLLTLKPLIIAETVDYLVIDKPAGIVVNKAKTVKGPTIQDLIIDYLYFEKKDLASPDLSAFEKRSGLAHRLDKDTSGVLLVAKNEKFLEHILKQFKTRQVKKMYVAGVFGVLPETKIRISAPLIRDPKSRTKFAVSREGREAITEVELENIYRFGETGEMGEMQLSIVKVFPLTGRTHQIRVHLCALGNAIVGDVVYSSKHQLEWAFNHGFNRLMLHAKYLAFTDLANKLVTFESKIPPDFMNLHKNS